MSENKEKAKFTRTQRPVFVAMQILDEGGKPVAFPKDQINIVKADKDAGTILDIMESGEYPHVTYKKIPLA
jgi:hypothetical protein